MERRGPYKALLSETLLTFPDLSLPQAGGSTGLLMDLAANEKAVHADFFNGKAAGSGASVNQSMSAAGCAVERRCDTNDLDHGTVKPGPVLFSEHSALCRTSAWPLALAVSSGIQKEKIA